MKRMMIGMGSFAILLLLLLADVGNQRAQAQEKSAKAPVKRLSALNKQIPVLRWQLVGGYVGGKNIEPTDYETTSEFAEFVNSTIENHWRSYDKVEDEYTKRLTKYSFTDSVTCPTPVITGVDTRYHYAFKIEETYGKSRGLKGDLFAGKVKLTAPVGGLPELKVLAYKDGITPTCDGTFENSPNYNHYVYYPQLTPSIIRDGKDHTVSKIYETKDNGSGNFERRELLGTHSVKFDPGTDETSFGKLTIRIEGRPIAVWDTTFPQFEARGMQLIPNDDGWIALDLSSASEPGNADLLKKPKPFVTASISLVALIKLRGPDKGWLLSIRPAVTGPVIRPRVGVFNPLQYAENTLFSVDPEFGPSRFAPGSKKSAAKPQSFFRDLMATRSRP